MSAPSGSLVAYSTAPGSVASDGSGRNGLYTEQFARVLQQPGLPVEEVFKQVRAAVRRASNNQQTPWENTALEGQFYFKAPVIVAAPAPQPIAAPKPSGPDPVQIEMALWDSVKASTVPAELQACINRHPNGFFTDVAKARIAALKAAASGPSASDRAAADATAAAERAAQQSQQAQAARQAQDMAFWDNIKVSNRPSELEAYIAQFPNGLFVGLAKVRLTDGKAVVAAVANAQAAQAVQVAAKAARPVGSAATVAPVQTTQPSISSGVLGQVVVTDQLTKKKQTIDVVVLEKTDQLISYSTGDKITSDGKVLSARMGTYVAELKTGSLWKFPLQAGSSGSAVAEFSGIANTPIDLKWNVKNVSGQRAVLEVAIQYRAFVGLVRYGTWQAEFTDNFAIPMQYKFNVQGHNGQDLFAGDFTKIASK